MSISPATSAVRTIFVAPSCRRFSVLTPFASSVCKIN